MKKSTKQLSPLARRVRQGIVPFRSGPDGDSARQLLQGLRADLDAVHRDQRSSANEKDSAAKRLLSTFKQRWTYEQTKANERAADVDRAARVLAERVAEVERVRRAPGRTTGRSAPEDARQRARRRLRQRDRPTRR
jgi:hypothetical protein